MAVALAEADVSADRAVFVGDAVWDVHAARRAGVPCVAVLSGGVGAATLREAGAAAVFDDTSQLLASITDDATSWLRAQADDRPEESEQDE